MFDLKPQCVGILTAVLVVSLSVIYWVRLLLKSRDRLYPPMVCMTNKDITRLTVNGTIHRFFMDKVAELGPVFRVPQELIFEPHFICCDPELARLVLEGDTANSVPAGVKRDQVKFFDKLTMNKPNILTKQTHGEGWDWARKGVAPAFSNVNLMKRLPEIQRKMAEFTDILDEHIQEGSLLTNFSSWMVKLTIDFISTTMFAQDFHTMSHAKNGDMTEGEVYLTQLPITIKEFVVMQSSDIKRRLMFWTKDYREAQTAAGKIATTGQSVLDHYRETHSEAEIQSDTSIIGHLIRGPYPSDLDRVADVTIFMLAGHDTTAYQLSWIIIELARHPEVVKTLREELDNAFTPVGPRDCTASQLSKLDYLSKVVKEGMRLWPVVANGSQRRILVDIPYKEYIIPKGATLAMNNFAMFRIGIQDGNEFIPERWNDGNPDEHKLKELFIPFASGKRNCVGQALALLELKLVIATLFHSYNFEIVGEFEEEVTLTMKPKNADLRVTHRVR